MDTRPHDKTYYLSLKRGPVFDLINAAAYIYLTLTGDILAVFCELFIGE